VFILLFFALKFFKEKSMKKKLTKSFFLRIFKEEIFKGGKNAKKCGIQDFPDQIPQKKTKATDEGFLSKIR